MITMRVFVGVEWSRYSTGAIADVGSWSRGSRHRSSDFREGHRIQLVGEVVGLANTTVKSAGKLYNTMLNLQPRTLQSLFSCYALLRVNLHCCLDKRGRESRDTILFKSWWQIPFRLRHVLEKFERNFEYMSLRQKEMGHCTHSPYIACFWVAKQRLPTGRVKSLQFRSHESDGTNYARRYAKSISNSLAETEIADLDPPCIWRMGLQEDVL